MPFNDEIVIERLKEIFKGEKQEETAKKLGKTQSDISKLVNGITRLTVPMAWDISEQYHVSIDWILGKDKSEREFSYYDAISSFIEMKRCGSIEYKDKAWNIVDPMLKGLLHNKALPLDSGDIQACNDWMKTELIKLKDKRLICNPRFLQNFSYYASEAYTIDEYLKTWEIGLEDEGEYLSEVEGDRIFKPEDAGIQEQT